MNAIEFDHISKLYRLGYVSTGALKDDIHRFWVTKILKEEDPYLKIGATNDRTTKGNSNYVWALKDIDFKVEQGDVVGIIGKNGAGKSTLLKLLSRVTGPTTGCIRARGRIGSLLEVGTGFHPEMTGRENIFMNGAILGMTHKEILSKLDEIIDFSGCERYIDTPVKRYSSGMMVRLGFAVAAHLEPEILVVDEVLAVGDAEFQKKAIGKMKDVSNGDGRTVLFVSHNMSSVRMLCNSGVVLSNGQVEMTGTAETCVNYYVGSNIADLNNHTLITQKNRPSADRLFQEVSIEEVRMLNDIEAMSTDEPIELELRLKRNAMLSQTQIVVNVVNEQDIRLINYISAPIDLDLKKNEYVVRLTLLNHGLPKGKYKLGFATGQKDYSMGSRNYDVVSDVLSFRVVYTKYSTKQEYYAWDSSWAQVVHENDCIDVSLI